MFQLTAIALCCQERSFSGDGLGVCRRLTEALPVAIELRALRSLSLVCSGCCRSCCRSLLQAAKLLGQGAPTHGTGRLLMARFNGRRLQHSHWDQVARHCLHCVRSGFGQFDCRVHRRYLGRCPSERHPLLYSRAMRATPRVMLVTWHQHCGVLNHVDQAHCCAALQAQYGWCAFPCVALRRRGVFTSECHPPLDGRADRTLPRVMLVPRHEHPGVLDHLDQLHLCAAY